MRSPSLLIFLSLLILSSSTLTNLRSSDLSLLENLRKSEFGRTLLKSIQLQLKARGSHPLTSILDLVNKIKNEIEDEQTVKQASYEEEKAECAAFESSIDSAITQDQQSIDDNTKNIVNLQNQLDGFESDLAAAEELQQSKQDQIDSIDTIREQENESYQAAVAELNQMIQALRDGKAILQRLLASNSNAGMFFEKNRILEKPSKEELHGVISLLQTPIQNGYLKMASLLFEMISKQDGEVDQTLLNNVLDLIDQLIAQLIDSRQTKSNTEDARKTAYDQERNSLESALVVVGSNIDNIKSTIKGINDQLLDLNADNIDLANKVITNQADKADKEQECSDYYHAYLAETQNRSNELEILDKIINIFETRFDKVDEYIRDLTF